MLALFTLSLHLNGEVNLDESDIGLGGIFAEHISYF